MTDDRPPIFSAPTIRAMERSCSRPSDSLSLEAENERLRRELAQARTQVEFWRGVVADLERVAGAPVSVTEPGVRPPQAITAPAEPESALTGPPGPVVIAPGFRAEPEPQPVPLGAPVVCHKCGGKPFRLIPPLCEPCAAVWAERA